ncbi:MAG: T9SS type A sorting domain-containing protein [Bacteroidales bacterium]|nr:T9SS type A sorting domain-containing protein [Bacteroidales bacterium]
MKKLIILILTGILVTGFSQGQGGWREYEMEVKIVFGRLEDASKLGALNLNGDIYSAKGYAILYVTPDELDLINSKGFKTEILKQDLNLYYHDFWTSRDQYHTYDEIIDVIDSLVETFPQIAKKYTYGTSLGGRQLCALKISDNVYADEPEPEVFFDAGIHGDEIGGPENLVRFAIFLCENHTVDPYITGLINTREIWLYIMVNPDGRVNMTRYNDAGVDLNRDYGYMWNGAGSSPAAYSQPETRAIRNCLLDHQFVLSSSYHSGTEFLAYTWSYRPDTCPDRPQIEYLADLYSTTSGYDLLEYGQGYTGMYPINGSSKDAAYGSLGSVGWTMEISYAKQPPASQIQYFYDINEPAMLAVIDQAGNGLHGTVTDAETGYPVSAAIFVDNGYPCYSDPVIGDYHKFLLPGTYTVKITANGYAPETTEVLIDNTGSTVLNFSLQPADEVHAWRVIACQIPASNFSDEAFTAAAIGPPDNVNYSLGHLGWIILDMGRIVFDGPGDEIIIYEGDNGPEGFTCHFSDNMDGPWQLAGSGTGTSAFDFLAGGIAGARYIRITDDGAGQVSGDNAGFDLDAIEAPAQPELIFVTMDARIDDQAANGNARIDPGETATLVITLQSLGSVEVTGGLAYLNYNAGYISIPNPETGFENIGYGESTELNFTMSCSSFCPAGSLVMMALNITTNNGEYMQTFPFSFTVGPVDEDWESAGFSQFSWMPSGNKPWVINFQTPYEGNCSARSGNIDDGEVSALEITLDVIGYDDISFYRKVSSQGNSDYLRFYIDNNLVDYWSGELSWERMEYDVLPGFHTFKWTFEKDGSGSSGSDAGFVDFIVFPSCNLDATFKVLANAWPNSYCGSGESQLSAFTIGGAGDPVFSWSPPEGLSDPNDQYPVATLTQSAILTVTASDGGQPASSITAINVFNLPATPVILQQGDSLISQADSGNQWYTLEGPVTGATEKVFYPETEDDYFVIITDENGCESDSSNIIHFIFTAVQEPVANGFFKVFPNPFGEKIIIQNKSGIKSEIIIILQDILGREIYRGTMKETDAQKIIDTSGLNLENGLYLIAVLDKECRLLSSSKLIKSYNIPLSK